ncbi:MAG TPA: hypothetical protein VMG36_06405 [Thermoplasmata archaeon]|nr:hypothetical protein [Thermoplasmata archaeon]
MSLVSLRYRFRQPFPVPARAAFAWCTDFGPGDGRLFLARTERRVDRLADDTIVLTDTTYPNGARRRIRRLVRLHPAAMAWTNTHLDGPFRYSQYWYRVVPDGARRSHLEFDGFRLVQRPGRPSATEVARLAAAECAGDAKTWREQLAPALVRDVRGR